MQITAILGPEQIVVEHGTTRRGPILRETVGHLAACTRVALSQRRTKYSTNNSIIVTPFHYRDDIPNFEQTAQRQPLLVC